MSNRIQFQINPGINPDGLHGGLKIALTGESGELKNLRIQSQDAISIIRDDPLLFEVIHPSLGELQAISVTYLGITADNQWHLDSIEIVDSKTRKHAFFNFDAILQSGESVLSGQNNRTRYGKFEIFKGKDKQFYFHLKAANGEIIAASEGYPSLSSARKGIASIKYNAESSPVIENF